MKISLWKLFFEGLKSTKSKALIYTLLTILSSCGSNTESKDCEGDNFNVAKASKPTKRKVIPAKRNKSGPDTRTKTTSLSDTVNLENIDYSLINARLFQKINREQERLSLLLFNNNNDLKNY